MKETVLIIINFFLGTIDNVTEIGMHLCAYALRVWRYNALRNFVFGVIRYVDYISSRLKNYIEGIATVLKYRMQYESVTKPMKEYYREIKRQR
jgi:hypothetical protein